MMRVHTPHHNHQQQLQSSRNHTHQLEKRLGAALANNFVRAPMADSGTASYHTLHITTGRGGGGSGSATGSVLSPVQENIRPRGYSGAAPVGVPFKGSVQDLLAKLCDNQVSICAS